MSRRRNQSGDELQYDFAVLTIVCGRDHEIGAVVQRRDERPLPMKGLQEVVRNDDGTTVALVARCRRCQGQGVPHDGRTSWDRVREALADLRRAGKPSGKLPV